MIRIVAAVLAILAGVYVLHLASVDVHASNGKLVPVVSSKEVLAMLGEGKTVVFVDSRERQEWQEERIPGAINVTLRDVSALAPGALNDPDLIIAYCVKDFRGLEVAKALRNSGYKQASILEELGLNGWKGRGLPTTVAGHRGDEEAVSALMGCAEDPASCVGNTL